MNINDLIFFTSCYIITKKRYTESYVLLTKLHTKRYLVNKYKKSIGYCNLDSLRPYQMEFCINGIITSNFIYTNHTDFIDKITRFCSIELLYTEYEYLHYYCLDWDVTYPNLYAKMRKCHKDLNIKSIYGNKSIEYGWYKYSCK